MPDSTAPEPPLEPAQAEFSHGLQDFRQTSLSLADQGVRFAVRYDRTDPEKRFIGYACISTYGQMLDTQLSRAHLRRRRRSGIGRLTDPTAADQLWLRAGSSCPEADVHNHPHER